jgi:hypothetical protein
MPELRFQFQIRHFLEGRIDLLTSSAYLRICRPSPTPIGPTAMRCSRPDDGDLTDPTLPLRIRASRMARSCIPSDRDSPFPRARASPLTVACLQAGRLGTPPLARAAAGDIAGERDRLNQPKSPRVS